jgi:hypothetical protein
MDLLLKCSGLHIAPPTIGYTAMMKNLPKRWESPVIQRVAVNPQDVPRTKLRVLAESVLPVRPQTIDETPGKRPSRWTESCWLELDSDILEKLKGVERWDLTIRDSNGQSIYAQARESKTDLNMDEKTVAIDPVFIMGDDARSMVIRAHLENGQKGDEVIRDIPKSFRQRHGSLLSWITAHQIPDRTISFCPIGGLANQLYQAAAMLGFSWRNNIPAVCQLWKTDSPSMVKRRPTYWDNVLSEVVKLGEGIRQDPRTARNYGDPSFTYTEIPNPHQHQVLWGHYLTYKYFHAERDKLLALLWGNETVQGSVETAYERLLARMPPGAASLVSIHVRRGDSLLNRGLTLMNMRYWEEAMARFPRSVFVVFSDDLPWCREQFQRPDVMFAEDNPDWVDLYLMARCDHNIIVNSTYSWWSAYINQNPDRRVIYPMPWFAGEKRKRDMSDFFLPEWTRIEVHE